MTDLLTKDRGMMMKISDKKTPSLHGPNKEVKSGVIMLMLVAPKTIGMLRLLRIPNKILKKDGVVLLLKLEIQRNPVKMKDSEMLDKVLQEDGAMKLNESVNL